MQKPRMKILIVEDELIIAEDLRSMLEELGYDVIGPVVSYEEALSIIKTDVPDLALLDITIEGRLDGIDLAAHLNKHFKLPIIFSTSNIDPLTIEKAKNVKSNGYLVKPFGKDDLYTSIELAIANFNATSTTSINAVDSIFVKDNEHYVRVDLGSILYLKSDGNYTDVVTSEKTYIVRGTVKETLSELDERFMRIHKSYVVQVKMINAVGPTSVVMKGEELPLGKMYKDDLVSRLKILK